MLSVTGHRIAQRSEASRMLPSANMFKATAGLDRHGLGFRAYL